MRCQTSRVGERHDDDHGVTEPVEVLAHGEHVFLAGQSSEMAVQHQHHRTTVVGVSTDGRPS